MAYEITMFFKTQAAFANNGIVPAPQNHQQQQFLSNLLTESYANHLRNLVDFFYPRKDPPYSTDVVTADYCPAGKWAATAPAISLLLEKARNRDDKEVAHLTSGRVSGTPAHKKWNDPQHGAEIRDLLKLFHQIADPKRLDPVIVALIASL